MNQERRRNVNLAQDCIRIMLLSRPEIGLQKTFFKNCGTGPKYDCNCNVTNILECPTGLWDRRGPAGQKCALGQWDKQQKATLRSINTVT